MTISSDKSRSVTEFFKADIAGNHFEIECNYRYVFNICGDYLAKFEKADFVIFASQQEIDNERVFACKQNDIDCKYNRRYTDKELESIAIHRKISGILLYKDVLLIHGAAIAINGKCFIFLAKSGTGKTTLIRKWLKLHPDTFGVNGDKPFVDVDNMLVWGSPWCGKERMNTNTSVPLGGLIWLERGENNEIEPISFSEMLPCLIKQTHFPEVSDSTVKVMKLLAKLQDIPCWHLKCNMDDEAGEVSYNALVKGEIKK